ncbi:6-phosphogluconolactonase [Clydaea vesicula]|uniref:6-phosphogluconolactonase n=1 Tax=Clydaea vesicula TaxID=447962 RepID=A0AAD5TVV8_9FUNG|nr:6-phosphogluconolactonase [Clydaea vesicula]KAJ3388994.1 6-phosphogluconolactonase [Lobulomyces angularis]
MSKGTEVISVSALSEFLLEISESSISNNGVFNLAISGGSMSKLLKEAFKKNEASFDFSKWIIFFADERLVKFDNKDSNFNASNEEIFKNFKSFKPENIKKIDQNLIKNPKECAVNYQEQIFNNFKLKNDGSEIPSFDLILLGLGPDGHTASLFPNHPLLNEIKLLVAPITDSPKPPPCRISFTYPLINNAKVVAFISTGESKAEVLKKILELKDLSFPATRVTPLSKQLFWFLDTPASSKLKSPI